ncbi:MAG: hypothetical protein JNM27_15620 [Leptospirales bacterium]|nr:hypothetical protein [Leptospirales bacterium]
MNECPFLVFRCADIEESRTFYESLGLQFTREQHGSGPIHYSAMIGNGLVLELYPAKENLQVEIGIPGASAQTLMDPDGRKVRLYQLTQPQ